MVSKKDKLGFEKIMIDNMPQGYVVDSYVRYFQLKEGDRVFVRSNYLAVINKNNVRNKFIDVDIYCWDGKEYIYNNNNNKWTYETKILPLLKLDPTLTTGINYKKVSLIAGVVLGLIGAASLFGKSDSE